MTRSRSYQTFIFPVFQFLLLSLRGCSIWKKCVYYTTAKLSNKKRKNYLFTKKKSLVGSAPEFYPDSYSSSLLVRVSNKKPIHGPIFGSQTSFKCFVETLKHVAYSVRNEIESFFLWRKLWSRSVFPIDRSAQILYLVHAKYDKRRILFMDSYLKWSTA